MMMKRRRFFGTLGAMVAAVFRSPSVEPCHLAAATRAAEALDQLGARMKANAVEFGHGLPFALHGRERILTRDEAARL